jgi:hypothetical protein
MYKYLLSLLLIYPFFSLQAQKQSILIKAGASCNCQSKVEEAVIESWNDYLEGISSADRVETTNPKLVLGVNVGVQLGIPLQDNWTFQPGLHLNIKGAKVEGIYGKGSSATSFSHQETLTYITVPLVFQYLLKNNIFFEAGPEAGVLVARKYKETEGTYSNEETDMSDFKKIELAVGAGAGYSFGKTGFGIYIKQLLGITKVDVSEPYYEKVRNTPTQIGFFYRVKRK